MATYGKTLLDIKGNVILPKTRSILVYMTDNRTVEETIERIKSGEQIVGTTNYLSVWNSAISKNIKAAFAAGDDGENIAFLWDGTYDRALFIKNTIDENARETSTSALSIANSANATAQAAMPKNGGRFTGECFAVARNSQTSCLRDIGIYISGGMAYANSYKLVCIRE